MSVAYLIQSHKNVGQVSRLVWALSELDPGCRIYISHDHRDGHGIEELAAGRVRVTRDDGGRGGFHPIARWLKQVEMVRQDGAAEYVVLISGQDYPIRPMSSMLNDLRQAGDGFLECFPALVQEGNHWPVREGRSRYLYRWRELRPISDRIRDLLGPLHALNFVQPWVRVNVAYGGVQVGLRRGTLPDGMQCFGGSMFPSLSWRAAEHVVHTVQTRPDIMRWAHESLVIDESFFQSVLMTHPALEFTLSAHRFFKFDRSRFGHPAILTEQDFPELATSEAYFARKFDVTVDERVLDVIDESLGIRYSGARQA